MDTIPNPRVLFADSDALLCVSARRALQERNLTVTIAHDGAEALVRFEQNDFDIAVIGISLRLVTGINVLREIKQLHPAMPVIFLDDGLPENIVAEAVREGAFTWLKIPLDDWDHVARTINQALELERLREHIETVNVIAPTSASSALETSSATVETEAFTLLRLLTDTARSGKPLYETLDLVVQATAQIMRVPNVMLLRVSGERMEPARTIGSSNGSESMADTFAWQIASERHTLINPLPNGHADHKMIGTPLIARDTVLGVLIAYPLPSESVVSEQTKWLELFAAHGALAIELEKLENECAQLAPTDPVTGLLKRSVFLDLADREFRRSWRYNQPLAAIIVGIDDFDRIQIRRSPALSDHAMRAIADACRSATRSIDLLCHYDNASFAVLLLMTTSNDALNVAERLRNNIAMLDVGNGTYHLRVTASLGMSAYPRESCASIFDLLAIAQAAQNAANRAGGNQVVCV
jgi:diguanylate cyclase (GGDEF)-like protein